MIIIVYGFTPVNLVSRKGHLAIMKKTQFIAFGLATIMSVQAFPIVAFAAEPSTNSSYSIDLQTVPTFSQTDVDSLIPIFNAIEQIPDDLLENGSHTEINNFFKAQGVPLKVYNDAIGETKNVLHIRNKLANALMCAVSIGELIVTVGIPATKITKIKKPALTGLYKLYYLM